MSAQQVEALDLPDGIHHDLDEAGYHADPTATGSLSHSGSKILLDKSPAHYRWDRLHGGRTTDALDFGTVAHTAVLGVGGPVVVVDADDWRSKAAREQRDAARAAGATPLLADDAARVEQLRQAVHAHEIAGPLFAHGQAETSLLWTDHRSEHGPVRRRARVDWTAHTASGRTVLVDLKSCVSAHPADLRKTIATYRYYSQAEWYLDLAISTGLAEPDSAFLFVFVEKTPPHAVVVAQLDLDALAAGAHRNARAIDLYARCQATGHWPAYTADIPTLSLPAWAREDSA